MMYIAGIVAALILSVIIVTLVFLMDKEDNINDEAIFGAIVTVIIASALSWFTVIAVIVTGITILIYKKIEKYKIEKRSENDKKTTT